MKELVDLHFGLHKIIFMKQKYVYIVFFYFSSRNFSIVFDWIFFLPIIVGKNKIFKSAIDYGPKYFDLFFQTDPKKAENFDNQFKTMTLRLSYSEQSVLDQMQGDEFEGFDFVNDNFYQYRNSAFIPQYS